MSTTKKDNSIQLTATDRNLISKHGSPDDKKKLKEFLKDAQFLKKVAKKAGKTKKKASETAIKEKSKKKSARKDMEKHKSKQKHNGKMKEKKKSPQERELPFIADPGKRAFRNRLLDMPG